MGSASPLLGFVFLLLGASAGPVEDIQSCLTAVSQWNSTYGPLSGTPNIEKFENCTATSLNKYCMLSVQIPIKQLPFRVQQAVCVPSTCSIEAVSGLCDGSIDCDNLPPAYASLQQMCATAQSLICSAPNAPQPINIQCAAGGSSKDPKQTAYAQTLGGALRCSVPLTSTSPFYQNLTAASSTGPNDLGDWDMCTAQDGARYCTCSYNVAGFSLKTGQCVPDKCDDAQFAKSTDFVCDPYTDCVGSASFLNPTSCLLTKMLSCPAMKKQEAEKKERAGALSSLPINRGGIREEEQEIVTSEVSRRLSLSGSFPPSPLSLHALRTYAVSRGLGDRFEAAIQQGASAFLGKRLSTPAESSSLSHPPPRVLLSVDNHSASPPLWRVLDSLLSMPPQGNLTESLVRLTKLKEALDTEGGQSDAELAEEEDASSSLREIEKMIHVQRTKARLMDSIRRKGAVVPSETLRTPRMTEGTDREGREKKLGAASLPPFSSTCDFSKPDLDWRTVVTSIVVILFLFFGLLALTFAHTIAQPGWDDPKKKSETEPETPALKFLSAFSPRRNWEALFRLSAPSKPAADKERNTRTQQQGPQEQQTGAQGVVGDSGAPREGALWGGGRRREVRVHAAGAGGGAMGLPPSSPSPSAAPPMQPETADRDENERGLQAGGGSRSSDDRGASSGEKETEKEGNKRPELVCLHGIRVLSLAWVIFGHSLAFWLSSVDLKNGEAVARVTQGFWYSLLTSAPFSVDSFFFLSGLLCVISLVPMFGKVKIPPVGLALLHRYLRLTPVYLLVIALYYWLSVYMGTGPLWPQYVNSTWGAAEFGGGNGGACGQYWWTNALYINNLYPTESADMCIVWSWYLANDMQFFIIALIVVALYTKVHKAVGWVLTGLLLVGCTIANAVITYDNSLTVAIFEQIGGKSSFDLVYDKPWTRIGPYAVGMLVGLSILEGRVKLDKWSSVGRAGTHLFIFALGVFLVFMPWTANKEDSWKWPTWANVMFLMADRSLWAVTLGWLVLCCLQGYAPCSNWILSWKAWAPLARMTYLAYLVHPVIMFIVFANMKGQEYYTEVVQLFLYFLGCWCATYLVAWVMTLLIEMPIANLEKILVEGIAENVGMQEKKKTTAEERDGEEETRAGDLKTGSRSASSRESE
uniref:Acyltransferase 3 domain-containing protein n=1 Tax=Chromera velia CCMP2878 TaxID=1169474 RepID=A0A0G4GST7_9ALVE|eukprot:Cvel_5150.t1-p1 / transcript=Cvel_5150.t1 / gene=Cvel_5150 / organism=Chromera_velia_CCMP2878 / gene_product=Nose resistant to fluoxetine protein 6, putative / transcript_product=Nose resistant to fluoxetine protein 6, putative / location=Cvel_scaffold236:16283-24786(-) / protein_length=1147 / sequence_SO=supercontig / SO=protein_coding / is_pseudo=false